MSDRGRLTSGEGTCSIIGSVIRDNAITAYGYVLSMMVRYQLRLQKSDPMIITSPVGEVGNSFQTGRSELIAAVAYLTPGHHNCY
jgi:hypothetical protein